MKDHLIDLIYFKFQKKTNKKFSDINNRFIFATRYEK